MSVLSRAYALKRLQDEQPALAMLRSPQLYLTMAFLSEYFTLSVRRIPLAEMHARMERDLYSLPDMDFQVTAQASELCNQWVNRKILARRQEPRTHEEYYELTAAGERLLTFITQFDTPAVTATQSRLALLTEQAEKLALLTNPDRLARLEFLHTERERIDAEIARVEQGEIRVLEADRAAEAARDLVQLARDVPRDFSRVQDEFEKLNRQVRHDLLDSSIAQQDTLNDVFYALDFIQQSDAGRSFNAFFALLLDSEQQARFDAAITGLAERGVLKQLDEQAQLLLHTYMSLLHDESVPVRETLTHFSRSLRQFVQSRQVEQLRALRLLLEQVQKLGLEATPYIPERQHLPVEIPSTSLSSQSVGRIKLSDPLDERTTQPVERHEPTAIDLVALKKRVDESEIDFTLLRANVSAALQDGPVTIGEVLQRFPATQGLASLVGLFSLALRHGEATGASELVGWKGQLDGVQRWARVDQYRFVEALDE